MFVNCIVVPAGFGCCCPPCICDKEGRPIDYERVNLKRLSITERRDSGKGKKERKEREGGPGWK